MIRHGEGPVAVLLALGLLLAALPFGAVVPWARTSLALGCFVALALAVLLTRREDRLRRVAVPLGALLAVALVGVLQLIPLPAAIARFASPHHARYDRLANEALVAAGLDPTPAGVRLTLAPETTERTVLWLLAVAAAFAAGHLAGRHRGQRRLLAAAVVLAGLFEVVYGARRLLAGPRLIWGVEVPGVHERLRGTFVNPNHLATFLAIALSVVLAWVWWAWQRRRHVDSLDGKLLLLLPPTLVWIALFTGLAFTSSRAGLAAVVVATICGAVLASIVERRKAMLAVGLLALVAGLGVAALLGLERAYGRLLEASPYDVSWSARARVYLNTLRLWTDYPIAGSGLGSFRDAFEPVQPAGLAGRWEHAHNDLLELLATGGLLSAGALAIGAFYLVRMLAKTLIEGIRTEDRAAGLAGLTMAVALLAHESLDYGMTMPAIAFTAAVLLGSATAASTRQYPSDISEGETEPPARE